MFAGNRRLGMSAMQNTANTASLGNSGIQGTNVASDIPQQVAQQAPSVATPQLSLPLYAPGMAPSLAMQSVNIPQPSGWVNPGVAQFGGWGSKFMDQFHGNGGMGGRWLW